MSLYLLILIFCIPPHYAEENDQKQIETIQNFPKTDGCTINFIKPKVIINPYKHELIHHVPHRPFSSICIKCAACLAIANEISEIYNTVLQNYKNNNEQELALFMYHNLSSLCNNGFQNYDLREYKNFHVLSDKFYCTSFIQSRIEGTWTEMLRKKCFLYTNYINFENLYNDYLRGFNNITNYLCRNNGVLRDCTNIDYTEVDIPSSKRTRFFGF